MHALIILPIMLQMNTNTSTSHEKKLRHRRLIDRSLRSSGAARRQLARPPELTQPEFCHCSVNFHIARRDQFLSLLSYSYNTFYSCLLFSAFTLQLIHTILYVRARTQGKTSQHKLWPSLIISMRRCVH